jgi:homoserine kinase
MRNAKVICAIVPATSANLGPGFDVLGAALKLYNTVEVSMLPGKTARKRFVVEVEGEGKGTLPEDERNIVIQAMKRTLGGSFPGVLKVKLINGIPLASGLGSSAAARLGGILAANAFRKKPLSEKEVISLGTELEGHPDNIVPAMQGGLCISVLSDNDVTCVQSRALKMKAVVCTPAFGLSTERARKVLPRQMPLSSAVFNLSRLALFMAAVEQERYELLGSAMDDRLHQPAREHLIPGMKKVFGAAVKAGAYGAALSGAGPSLIALTPADKAAAVSRAMQKAWQSSGVKSRAFTLDFDTKGARVTKK